jgi:glutamate-1-semialdehyde 2,1-aminomutase
MSGSVDAALKDRALKVIPNGMYGHESVRILPEGFPQFFSRAKGAYIWDADGNRYLDFMCAYGPSLLGYLDERVDTAARKQLEFGDAMTGPAPVMVELAETIVSMVEHADWAMFCKNGTDATSMAVLTARAQTGKRVILIAEGAYHGAAAWCTPVKAGVLAEDRSHQITYLYNDVASLEAAVAAAGDDLAAILATPFKHDVFVDQEALSPDYARRARELCDATGAMLVVDDVRAGFRLARDSSWSLVGVKPDLSCWGKAVANGHPLSILLGNDRCREGAGAIYVTGSFWFAAVPMAAAIETLKIIRESDYLEHIARLGDRLRAGLADGAAQAGLKLRQSGPSQMPLIMFGDDPDVRIGYAWAQEMLSRGVYMHPWHNMFLCAAMTEQDIDMAIRAGRESFDAVASRLDTIEPSPILAAMIAARSEPELETA